MSTTKACDGLTGRLRLMLGAAFIVLPVSPAFAQDGAQGQPASQQGAKSPEDAPAIIVTGLRETLQTSFSTKRHENAIVDSLSSKEIGDLPGQSIGEAIATITGAAADRGNYGPTEITLRGLGSLLTLTTFNGREATTGNGDRAINFGQFPSELFNGITIYKSQQANLIEGGVAGSIDLQTRRPLDYRKRQITAELKTNYNPYDDRVTGESAWGLRGTASYIDQFDLGDLGRLGISVGVQSSSVSDPNEVYIGSGTWNACNPAVVSTGNCSTVSRAAGSAGAPFYLAPNSLSFRQMTAHEKRNAVFGAVQWQPSSRIDINVDLEYSKRNYVEDRHDLGLTETRYNLSNVQYDSDGKLLYANGTSTLQSLSTLFQRRESYIGGGGNMSFRASDRLTIKADVSYSRTVRNDLTRSARLRSDPLDIYGRPTAINNQRVPYTYDARGDSFGPTITVDPRFNLNDPTLFSDDAQLTREELQKTDRIFATRLDLSYKTGGFLSEIDAGARYSRRHYSSFDDLVTITQDDRNVDASVNAACRQPFPQSNYLSDAPGNPITSWATFNTMCQFRQYLGTEDPGRSGDLRSIANADVTETVWAGYAMARYASKLGKTPVRGNFGVRVVHTGIRSTGLRSGLNVIDNGDGTIRLQENGNFDSVVIKNDTLRFLPSFNANFELTPRVMLRVAGYRSMSRPSPSALSAGREITLQDGSSFANVQDAISQIVADGSPRLKPIMSWNGDLAAEFYPNRDSILAATLYYKQFTGGYIPVAINEAFQIGGQTVSVPVVQTENSTKKSRVYGIEMTAAHRFSWLPHPLDGLGFKTSYNYAASNFKNYDINLGDVTDATTGATTPGMIPPAGLSGYSKHVFSGQLYYQLGKATFQAIYRYRSSYYQDFVGGGQQLRYVRGNGTLDLSFAYQISKVADFRFQVLNITNTPKVDYMPIYGSTREYQYFGPQFFAGYRLHF